MDSINVLAGYWWIVFVVVIAPMVLQIIALITAAGWEYSRFDYWIGGVAGEVFYWVYEDGRRRYSFPITIILNLILWFIAPHWAFWTAVVVSLVIPGIMVWLDDGVGD